MSFLEKKPQSKALEKAEESLRQVKEVERFFCLWEQVLVEIEYERHPIPGSGYSKPSASEDG